MQVSLHVTGTNRRNLEPVIRDAIRSMNARALFMGCAYVSIYGAEFVRRLVNSTGISAVSLITDIRDAVTHPSALRLALDERWSAKVVDRAQGTFHPKVFLFSEGHTNSLPLQPLGMFCGSNNLSRGGLLNNVEASIRLIEAGPIAGAAAMASGLWQLGQPLTRRLLTDYEKRFRERNSTRAIEDLAALGVSDDPAPLRSGVAASRQRSGASFARTAAQAAWAGLESFTGDYTFQLEFPRDAGFVLSRLAGTQAGRVSVECTDGYVRNMTYAYYPDNGMFRLNIPNDVPGVAQARVAKAGIALVERNARGARLRLTVSNDPGFVHRVEGRSFALGTWGETPTRFYGWY